MEHGQRQPGLYPVEPLTWREKEILDLLADNQSNRQIANELVLSVNTVKWYLRQIYGKLNAGNRRQAVVLARKNGLLDQAKPKHNLPSPPTEFIHRSEEKTLADLITGRETRLVSVTGLGGVGKSRLVLQVAASLAQAGYHIFRDGIYFIHLTPVPDPEVIPSAIAEALDLTFSGDPRSPQQQLIDYLDRKALLLILDNFEHLLSGANLVAEILNNTTDVRIVTTSREPLRLHAEMIFDLRGLPYPPDSRSENFWTYPAAALFAQRARFAGADFMPDDRLQACVLKICRLVEGLPLAIELAAAWLTTLDCQEIADEIETSIDILGNSLRGLPERQQSIRVVLESSWNRLTFEERTVLMKLSAFVGGFTRAAAASVAGANKWILASLVQRSMLWRTEGGHFALHELIRQYGREQLSRSGIADAVFYAHADYFASLLSGMEAELKGGSQVEALDTIHANLDNLYSAWKWSVDHLEIELVDQMVEGLYLFCVFRRGQLEGIALIKKARDKLAETSWRADQRLWARVAARYEMLNIDRLRLTNPERIDDSSEILRKALAIAQESGETAEIAFCLHAYGRSLSWSLKLTTAISIFDQTLAYCARIKDDFYLAYTYYRLSFCYSILGNSQVALENTRRGLEIARRIGNDYVIAWNLDSQAFALIKMGRLDEAIQNFNEEIPIRERLGDQQGIVWAIAWQGLITFYLGNFQKALNLSRTAVETARTLNDQASIGLAYAVHGWVLASLGRYPDGKRFSAEALLLLTGSNLTAWAVAQIAWAYTHCQDGDIQAVKENFLSALQRNWEFNHHRLVVSMLPVWCFVLARESKHEEALELLSLALHHPARYRGWLEQELLIPELKTLLADAISERNYSAAWGRGQQLDLELVINKILGEIA